MDVELKEGGAEIFVNE